MGKKTDRISGKTRINGNTDIAGKTDRIKDGRTDERAG